MYIVGNSSMDPAASTGRSGVSCAGCNEAHSDSELLDAQRTVPRHTYKSAVIVYCEQTTVKIIDGRSMPRQELYLVVLKQRLSGFYQPFAKGSIADKNHNGPGIQMNTLSAASRELKEETGLRVCVRTLYKSALGSGGEYAPRVASKMTLFVVKQDELSALHPEIGPNGEIEIESAEWMKFEDFLGMITTNSKSLSKTTWKMLPILLKILSSTVSPVFSGMILDASQQYPEYTKPSTGLSSDTDGNAPSVSDGLVVTTPSGSSCYNKRTRPRQSFNRLMSTRPHPTCPANISPQKLTSSINN